MTRLIIIIPAAILAAVRVAVEAAFGEVEQSEFVPAGSPTGGEPATHYWLAGVFTEAKMVKVAALQAAFPTAYVESYDLQTQPGRPMELLGELGLQPLIVNSP